MNEWKKKCVGLQWTLIMHCTHALHAMQVLDLFVLIMHVLNAFYNTASEPRPKYAYLYQLCTRRSPATLKIR